MANLNESIVELKTLISQCETELQSLHGGKKAAAPRVRASLQKIKNLAHSMRGGVMAFTKDLPVKTRTKKENAEPPVEPPVEPVLAAPVLERAMTEAPVAVPVKPKRVPKPRKKTSKPKNVE
jgi:hypothetical protein